MSSKGGLMPQFFKIDNDYFRVSCKFVGFRKCPCLCWFPYMTGSQPTIKMRVEVKDRKYTIRRLAIKHIRPDGTFSATEWQTSGETGSLGQCYIYEDKIVLGQLKRAGFHNYELSGYLDDSGHKIPFEETLLSTAHVPWLDSVIRGFLLFAAGGLIGWLMQWLIN